MADNHAPTTDSAPTHHEVTTDPSNTEGYKPLQVKTSTHQVVRAASRRLGRSADSIVLAGIILLNGKTAAEQAQSDAEWARSFGS